VATGHLETVRTYWAASALTDYAAAGAGIGRGYEGIDQHKGVACRTMEELLEAQAEDAAWSDRTFEITNILETTDGALVVHATISGCLNGYWCYLTGQGQHVTFDACVIFRFNEDGLIISEEHYSDALPVVKQLEATAPGQ
jgi:hypothetical protein